MLQSFFTKETEPQRHISNELNWLPAWPYLAFSRELARTSAFRRRSARFDLRFKGVYGGCVAKGLRQRTPPHDGSKRHQATIDQQVHIWIVGPQGDGLRAELPNMSVKGLGKVIVPASSDMAKLARCARQCVPILSLLSLGGRSVTETSSILGNLG